MQPVSGAALNQELQGGCKESLMQTGMWDVLQTFVGGFIVIALNPLRVTGIWI